MFLFENPSADAGVSEVLLLGLVRCNEWSPSRCDCENKGRRHLKQARSACTGRCGLSLRAPTLASQAPGSPLPQTRGRASTFLSCQLRPLLPSPSPPPSNKLSPKSSPVRRSEPETSPPIGPQGCLQGPGTPSLRSLSTLQTTCCPPQVPLATRPSEQRGELRAKESGLGKRGWGRVTSLAPHERLPEILVVPRL